MQFPPVAEQLAVIRRGVEKIVPEAELAEKLERSLRTGVPLRVKYGIDPTGIDVHLGHTVPLRKMRQFQELGHLAIIIIGNYTALVGDPSGRDQTRARLTPEQVETNAKDYLTQVGKVVDLSRAEVRPNGEWFSAMRFLDVLELCSKVTIAQLLTRDDFSKRYQAEQPIFLHECLYPVMQAWDSVQIQADVELGGTEQLYSFMLARDLQRDQGLSQQIGVMTPILVGLDGVRRMGKSLGNYIGVNEPPYEMMKKFMQVPDAVMRMYFELLTDIPLAEVERLLSGHPKEAKIALGKSVISQYHGNAAAEDAVARWQSEVAEKALPAYIPLKQIVLDDIRPEELFDPASEEQYPGTNAVRLLVLSGLCKSTSDARRSIEQGGAYYGDEKCQIHSSGQIIEVTPGLSLWVGKKRVVRVELMRRMQLKNIANDAYAELKKLALEFDHSNGDALQCVLGGLQRPGLTAPIGPEAASIANAEIEIRLPPRSDSPMAKVKHYVELLRLIHVELMNHQVFGLAGLYLNDADAIDDAISQNSR
ncbi:MAG: tyrosine--tRNA ligase [Planctomycetales bacterium]